MKNIAHIARGLVEMERAMLRIAFFEVWQRMAVVMLVAMFFSSWSAHAGTLTVANGVSSNVTASNAVLWVTLSDTNSTNTTLCCWYGLGNGGTNTALWQYSNQWGIATIATNVYITTTNILSARSYYYYRWRAVGTTTVWAASSATFTTVSHSVTSWPDVATNDITQMVDASGLWLTPSRAKVLTANNLATNGAFASFDAIAAESNRAVAVEQQLGLAVTNLQTATNALDTRADALETSTGTLNTAVGNLNTATGSLNTAVGSLQTNTLKLAGGIMEGPATNEYGWYGAFTGDGSGLTNLTAPAATNSDALGGQSAATWVAATGSLNTAVSDLNAATGSLNSALANILTATGALNSAVADLQTSTGALNSAVVQLQTDTGTIWTTVGTLNTATNSLNTRVTDLEGGGDAAGWSGYDATQRVNMATFGVSNAAYFHGGKLVIGTTVPEPTGAGAMNLGTVDNTGDDSMIADNIGAFNIGYVDGSAGKAEMIAGGAGGMCGNIGRVSGDGGMYASAYGCLNLGAALGVVVTNTGAGSLALADSSGNITLSHSASIILGNGTSQEDRSILADVVRARTAFYGNGYNLTNLNLSSTFGTTDSTAARGDWFAAVSGRVDNLITATQTLNTATNSLNGRLTIAETNFVPLAGATMNGGLTNTYGYGLGTNLITLYGGVLGGTNGVYFNSNLTNYWILLGKR